MMSEDLAALYGRTTDSACCLDVLQKRSQIDFEIDFFERILSRDRNNIHVLVCLGDLFSLKGLHRRALQIDERLAELCPDEACVWYNLACSRAVLKMLPEAWKALVVALEFGFDNYELLANDPDLAPLRAYPKFASLLSLAVAS